MDFSEVHPDFRLNGILLNKSQLLEHAERAAHSQEPHQQQFAAFIAAWFDENDFIEVSTSGTTGTPKIIAHSKQAMVNSAKATGAFFELKAGCKALHCLPLQFIAGKMMLVRAIVLGWDLHLVKPDTFPLDGNAATYDFAAMVPLQIRASLPELHRIKKIIIGGAKLDTDLAEKLKDIPSALFETYGMTETITHIAAKKIQEPTFTVLPGISISLDDRKCLVIEAPRLSELKIVTNDIVEIVDLQHFIWLGRFDNVINSGGIKLFPERIEERLSTKISNRFFVIGKPDVVLGEKLVLVIEGEPYDLEPTVFDLLEKYEKPKEIIFVPAFTETESGKIKRHESLK